MENLIIFKRRVDLIIGLQCGELKIEISNFWQGGIDSCIYTEVKNTEIVNILDTEKNEMKTFVQIENEDYPLTELCEKNFEKIYNYYEKM